MKMRRRWFLKTGGIAMVGIGAGLMPVPGFLARAAGAARRRGKTLIVVFQRGAADGLNTIVPFGEEAYYALRPTIAVAPPAGRARSGAGGDDAAIDLDGFFGLHPRLAPLAELWRAEKLAVVVGAGSPHATRSHFDAQDFMESGTPGVKSTEDGWLNRYLGTHPDPDSTEFRAVAATRGMPRILSGPAPALAIPELSRFGIPGGRRAQLARAGLERLYGAAGDELLAPVAADAFDAVDLLQSVDPTRLAPEHGAEYPRGAFGRAMRQLAQLVKSGIGLEIGFAELGGWDHHVNEGGARGPLAARLRELAGGIAAFVRDLDGRMDDVVLVTLSEFGRSARENGSRGTDHGHANSMLVVGGGVRGGRVYGDWPGLAPEQLWEGRDLALTVDFRDVLGLALRRHLGAGDLARVFPGRAAPRTGGANLAALFRGDG